MTSVHDRCDCFVAHYGSVVYVRAEVCRLYSIQIMSRAMQDNSALIGLNFLHAYATKILLDAIFTNILKLSKFLPFLWSCFLPWIRMTNVTVTQILTSDIQMLQTD